MYPRVRVIGLSERFREKEEKSAKAVGGESRACSFSVQSSQRPNLNT